MILKRLLTVLMAAMLMTILTACGEDEEEVYEKAVEVANDMESAEIKAVVDQTIDYPEEGEPIKTENTFDMEMTLDPMAIHQKGATHLIMEDMEDIMDLEMYLIEDDLYIYESTSKQWLKTTTEMFDAIDMGDQQQDPAEQLKMIQDYTKELEFEENDDSYMLTLNADGEEFDKLFQEVLDETLPAELMDSLGKDEQEMLKSMKMNALDYKIEINKKNYEMKSFNMKSDITLEVEGDELTIAQDMKAVYSNINGVDPIVVPQDVIDQAVDMPAF